ncbi:phage integrase N-terminal SAM-like domain-containing protein, partial [Pseudoalteromonas sp. UCD-33C]
MNPLIEQVKTEIAYRGYSQRTCKSYCEHLLKLSHYFDKPLDLITDKELNAFFNDPAIRKLS